MKDPRYNNPDMLKENRYKLMEIRWVREQEQEQISYEEQVFRASGGYVLYSDIVTNKPN